MQDKLKCPHCHEVINIEPGISNEWDVVCEAIERNKGFRVQWKKYFGTTLTKASAKLYAKGLTADEAYKKLSSILNQVGETRPKIHENLKIGVCARYGEIKSEAKAMREQ